MVDGDVRMRALTRLAMATRERVDRETYVLYLDDTQRVETPVLVEACRRLERTATWFPKLAELLEACHVVAKEIRTRDELARPRLTSVETPPPERVREWIERIRQAARGHRMPEAK